MPSKKTAKKHYTQSKPTDVKGYADKIEKFLKKVDRPYSEPNLLADLFGIKKGVDMPSERQRKTISLINNALKLLVQQKKVIALLLENPKTKEDELHYSAGGWYATP